MVLLKIDTKIKWRNLLQMVKFYEEANAYYEKCRDPFVFGDLRESIENSIDFRNNVSVVAINDTLDHIRRKLSVQSCHTVDLLSNYLSAISDVKKNLGKVNEENVGEVTFLAGLQDTRSISRTFYKQLFCSNVRR
jgi:hypothetical protein